MKKSKDTVKPMNLEKEPGERELWEQRPRIRQSLWCLSDVLKPGDGP